MGIINTQAVADGRKVRTGKDGALYNGKGKLLATVEVFQAQMGVTNQKYHPLGTPLEQEILDSIGTTLTFTECVVEDGEFITDLLKMQSTGIQPNWKLQGVVKGINGSEERLIYPNCVPSGNIDLQNVSVGSLVKRQWSLFVNGEVKQQVCKVVVREAVDMVCDIS